MRQPKSASHPFVCGVVGEWRPETVARLIGRSPFGLALALRTDHAEVWSSDRLESWTGTRTEERGLMWSSLADGTRPNSWRCASEDRMACGVTVGRAGAIVHTDALGLNELYIRRIDEDAVYFATRIDPLVGLVGRPLHVDWSAWSGILTMYCAVAGTTPFEEIRRVERATAWSAGSNGVVCQRYEPSLVAATDTPRDTGPDAVVDAVRNRVRQLSRLSVTHLPLSGGWDSRLLAGALTHERPRRVRAWTTSPDDGRDLDVSMSAPVASALGIKRRVVLPGPEAWVENVDVVRNRVQYQTQLHTWLMPVARELHSVSGLVIDGLAGDFAVKGLWVTQDVLDGSDGTEQRRRLFGLLGGRRVEATSVLDDSVRASVLSRAWHTFDDDAATFDGHPCGLTLGLLSTRVARAIASSPLCLLAPECRVVLPFVDPHVLQASLSVPVERKIGGQFYRAVLERACGSLVATLPSTNDNSPLPPQGHRRQSSDAALDRLIGEIGGDDIAMGLLAPAWRDRVDRWRSGNSRSTVDPTTLTVLQGLGLFASWRARYRDVLADPAVPD